MSQQRRTKGSSQLYHPVCDSPGTQFSIFRAGMKLALSVSQSCYTTNSAVMGTSGWGQKSGFSAWFCYPNGLAQLEPGSSYKPEGKTETC